MRIKILLSAAVALASVSAGHGATVFNSGTFGVASHGYFSDPSFPQIMATQFTIAAGVSISIDSIRLEGFYQNFGTPGDDHFTIAIMANDNGEVGGILTSFSEVAGTRAPKDNQNGPAYEYNLVPTSSIHVPAGTYWFSIMNDSAPDWVWMESGGPGSLTAVSNSSTMSDYFVTPEEASFVFSFDGTAVPEPSATMLGGLAMGLLMLRKRR